MGLIRKSVKEKKNIIVMKFGGTSVSNTDKIKKAADRVIKAKLSGYNVVVAVSAMGDSTDNLIDIAKKIDKNPSCREMDMLMSTGEQVSIALLSMAIKMKGYDCISLTGNQAGILTDDVHSNAKIININKERILKELANNKIVVVAGFQGVTPIGEITTLGRGGSDTTAVALASALRAKYCEIYTDVDGVYTTDPNVDYNSNKIKMLSYDEMLEFAASGAKVLHLRAVEFAKKHNVVLHVRSSFNDIEGTWVMNIENKDEIMEKPLVSGVIYDKDQVKISVFGLPDKPGVAAKLFGELAAENINVDLIVQSVGEGSTSTISLTVKEEYISSAKKVLEKLRNKLSIKKIEIDPEVAKVSIIGSGMQTHPGVAARMFKYLGDKGINIEMISTSPIRISCIVRKNTIKKAVKALHIGFGLNKPIK